MGDVNRNATLVVAAAGASDSTDGLFVPDRPYARVYRVPYLVGDSVRGSFNLSRSSTDSSPSKGILATRAQAFQERYPARRTLYFMPYGIFWMRKRTYVNEMSTYDISGFNEQNPRLDLLNAYTDKKLTYLWNRLYALRGTINELRQT
jgi:hypothetical protein